ncbi:MAG TPA: HAMP domain-containing sensor histidine kinase, partial [Desulfuromonadaceae bacterium]|nr:HAMP domain-containing sensor histidine kinase [Desulfuromonadaceae bacterium]
FFLTGLWYCLFEKPSFVAPVLLQMTEERVPTNNRVRWMRQLWDAQSKVRAWAVPLRTHPELTNHWNPPSFWSSWTGESREALALLEPSTFTNMGTDLEGVPLAGRGYDIWFVPREVVEAIFSRALADHRSLVPDYVRVNVDVAGKPLLFDVGPSEPVLATAGQKAGPRMDAVPFNVRFYLTSREQMLSAERQRSKRLTLLILVSALAAFAGLFSAYRAFRRQEQLNELKSNFVSSVSHELRTPIASVRLMAENLERGAIPEAKKQTDYFHFIVQECRRLSGLIENILDFSRIEQGRKQYDFEPTDITALTRQTVRLMETTASDRQVRLDTTLPAETVAADIDGKAIQQALVNLIDNAIKHSPKDATVRIGLEFATESFRLWVEDNGDGIAPEEHEKIFERFYRCGSELRRETEGVGIGLSIVKHIVDAHRGRITVRSTPGAGSRFTIELPINHSTQG